MACYYDARTEELWHVFEVEDPLTDTPRERCCECADTTWGAMEDMLLLTSMWERSS